MMNRPEQWLAETLAFWLLGLTCGLFGLSGGCARVEDDCRIPVVIFGLDDRISSAPKGIKFDLKKARLMLAEAFGKSKRLKLAGENAKETYRAELTITLASERESHRAEEDEVYRAVQVDLVLYRWLGDHEQDKISSVGKAFLVHNPEQVERQEGFEQVLGQAIVNSVEYIDIQLEGRSMPTEGLRKLLASDRTEDRLYVLRTLREWQNS